MNLLPRITRRIWLLSNLPSIRACLKDRFRNEQVVLIASSPRSGSTWLSNVLGSALNYVTLFEPLHLDHVPAAREAGFDWRTYRHELAEWNEGAAFLKSVFRGNLINSWTAREITLKTASRSSGLLVKCVRATRLLPWISRQFPEVKIIHLVRDPLAVIASQLQSRDWQRAKRPVIPEFLTHSERAAEVLANLQGTADFLAAQWALDQWVARHTPEPLWLEVRYESLRDQPAVELERISQYLSRPFDVARAVEHLSVVSRTSTKRKAPVEDDWRKTITNEQELRIRKTVAAFDAIS
jgi:hypothetical protein